MWVREKMARKTRHGKGKKTCSKDERRGKAESRGERKKRRKLSWRKKETKKREDDKWKNKKENSKSDSDTESTHGVASGRRTSKERREREKEMKERQSETRIDRDGRRLHEPRYDRSPYSNQKRLPCSKQKHGIANISCSLKRYSRPLTHKEDYSHCQSKTGRGCSAAAMLKEPVPGRDREKKMRERAYDMRVHID